MATEFFSAVPESMKDGLSAISTPEVAQLAAKTASNPSFISLGARRLPPTTTYVVLLGLTRSQVGCSFVNLLGGLIVCQSLLLSETRKYAAQIPDVKRLLSNSRAEAVFLLTTSPDRSSDAGSHSFLTSFETTYCFEPIAIKVIHLLQSQTSLNSGSQSY